MLEGIVDIYELWHPELEDERRGLPLSNRPAQVRKPESDDDSMFDEDATEAEVGCRIR